MAKRRVCRRDQHNPKAFPFPNRILESLGPCGRPQMGWIRRLERCVVNPPFLLRLLGAKHWNCVASNTTEGCLSQWQRPKAGNRRQRGHAASGGSGRGLPGLLEPGAAGPLQSLLRGHFCFLLAMFSILSLMSIFAFSPSR